MTSAEVHSGKCFPQKFYCNDTADNIVIFTKGVKISSDQKSMLKCPVSRMGGNVRQAGGYVRI